MVIFAIIYVSKNLQCMSASATTHVTCCKILGHFFSTACNEHVVNIIDMWMLWKFWTCFGNFLYMFLESLFVHDFGHVLKMLADRFWTQTGQQKQKTNNKYHIL